MRIYEVLFVFCWTTVKVAFSVDNPDIDPRTCCKYPMPKDTGEISKSCNIDCKGQNADKLNCCMEKCFYNRTGIFDGVNFNGTNFVATFENTDEDSMSEKWKSVMSKNMENCENSYPKSAADEECVPDYIRKIFFAFISLNFLNCPNFIEADECDKLKKIVRNRLKHGMAYTLNHYFLFFHRG